MGMTDMRNGGEQGEKSYSEPTLKFPASDAQAGNEERGGERGKKEEEKVLLFRVIFLDYY